MWARDEQPSTQLRTSRKTLQREADDTVCENYRDDGAIMSPDAKLRTRGCLALLVFLVVPSCVALNWLGDAMCETTIYQRAISPSGFLEARVQMTDCGATSGFSRVVWIKPRFAPDSQLVSCRAVIFEEQPKVALKWLQERLKIDHDAQAEQIRQSKDQCYFVPLQIESLAK
jgi:hypothetical protein